MRGLRTKTNDVHKNILISNYKIIVFTETWLNSSIFDNELFDSRYVIYRKDRVCSSSKKDGGGVLIAISREISSSRIINWETDDENVWVVLEFSNNNVSKRIALCVVYLPPPVKLEKLNKFLDSVDNVTNHIDDLVVIGDFNMGFMEWSANGSNMTPSNYNNALGYSLVDFMSINNIYQYNSVSNCDDRFLDLVLSNIPHIKVTKPPDLLSKLDSYHPSLLISIECGNVSFLRSKTRIDYSYYKADYNSVVREIKNIDWLHKFSDCKDVDAMVKIFYECLFDIIDLFVPKHKFISAKYPTWFKHNLIKLLSEKDKLRRKYRKYNNPRDSLEFQILRSRCHKLFDLCLNDYKDSTESNISKNPKHFWKYFKNKKKGESSLPGSMKLNGTVANSGSEIANLFANHFSSIYTVSTNCIPVPYQPNSNIPQFSKLKIFEADVLKKLKKIDPQKGAGPDSLPPIFVKRCGPGLAFPLTLIFNRSLEEGIFPEEWKKARIVPVHKKGDRMDIKNYRPISILSCFSKLFESLVQPVLAKHLDNFLTSSQHGFRSGLSVQTNLTNFTSDLLKEVDNGHQVDAIYTDFSSAFDKVDHQQLVNKLSQYGIGSSFIKWFESYLAQRSQIVVINGFESKTYLAQSGVPQGSHLGPLLFLAFINDITTEIKNSSCSLFADDLKIYRSVKSDDDVKLIQDDLNRIVNWCKVNSMSLNVNKCFHVKFTRKKKPLVSSYSINNVPVQELMEIKDLGITIDRKLTFKSHINNVVNKAAQLLGFIKRNTKAFSFKTKILLFNALVRSHLEFASVIWNPSFSVHSQRIESVQRAFTRHLAFYASGFSHRQPYNQRLTHFKLISLRNRREILDLCYLYKILHNKVKCSKILNRISLSVPRRYPRWRISKIFHIPFTKTRLGSQAPIVRICCKYNELSKTMPGIDIFHDSYTAFKKKLTNHVLANYSLLR